MSKFKVGDRVRDVSPHAAGLGTDAGTIIGRDEGDNWLIYWDATQFYRINWHDNQIELMPQTSQAEIARLRAALEFYADQKRYQGPNQRADETEQHRVGGYRIDVTRDGGDIARKALSENGHG